MRPLTAIGVVLIVALPWYMLVGWQTDGAWTRGFFLEHNLGRATSAMEGHSGGIWFYPATILVGFFPWSVFAVPVLLNVIQSAYDGSLAKWFCVDGVLGRCLCLPVYCCANETT